MKNKRNVILLIIAVIAVYINCLGNGFVWDDIFTVVNNDFIKGPQLIKEVFSKQLYYFANADYLYYRPVQSLSNILDYLLWGLNPFGFHLTNLLLHILAVVLVYFFINTIFEDRELSFFSSLLFAVHPVNRSVVNHITSRSNILLAIFALSSSILFLKANNFKKYLLSLLCFALALLSKETAVIFPLFLIFINEMYLRLKNEGAGLKAAKARAWYAAFLIVTAAYFFLRIMVLGLKSGILPPYEISFLACVFTFLLAIFDYLKLIFLASNFYMLRTIDVVQLVGKNIIPGLISLFLIAAVLWRVYKLNKTVFMSLGIFLIWIIPVFSLSVRNPEYYFQQKAIIEEHWLYMAAIGIFVIMFYFFRKAGARFAGKFYKPLFLVFIIYSAVITFNENKFWKNNYTIFTRTAEFVKNSYTIYRDLGWVYINKRDAAKAIDMFGKALSIKQDDAHRIVLYKDIAYAYYLNNQTGKALDYLLKAVSLNNNYADAHAYLGSVYLRSDLNKAKEEWMKALDIDRFNETAFNNLLNLSKQDVLLKDYLAGKYNNFQKDNNLFENYRYYRALGLLYLNSGMYPLSFDNLSRAASINPYDVKTSNALAVYYAQTGQPYKALKSFKVALKLNPFEVEVYKNLAVLYEQLGQPEEAAESLRRSGTANVYN